MPSISTFTILKNESEYIGYHIMSLLKYVNEMIFADGNSTDGTLEIIKYIQKKYDKEGKIKLFENKDCKNLDEDYVRLFNWTLKQCKSNYVWFIHPDMICLNPSIVLWSLNGDIRYSINVKSLAGKRDIEIIEGRGKTWATIYKNDYGLHFHGYYGNADEDFYFRDFTGSVHELYLKKKMLPYDIVETKINLIHYCDCKPYKRRYERMVNVLTIGNPSIPTDVCIESAKNHPRVTLENGSVGEIDFVFKKYGGNKPKEFKLYDFERFRK